MNKQQLAAKIWESANQMRSKIEANEYKDYILGFIFYKYLSDKQIQFALKNDFTDADIQALSEEDTEAVEFISKNVGYFISYDHLFSTWISKGKDFDVSDVRDGLSSFNRLINDDHRKLFDGVFDTLETGLSKLGDTAAKQTKAISDLIHLIKAIPMDGKQDFDVLGFIYEYLISMFAANAGKKAGEFYTPNEVSVLMSDIIANHLKDRKEIQIYDSTSGSGSLLINIGHSVAKHMEDDNNIKYYAQELKQNTYNLTRMNLVMRGILPNNIQTRNGDTLEEDWPYFDENDPLNTYNPLYLDAVVSNPPYSQKWEPSYKEADARYSRFGLAPKGKADYAFLLHDLYHLKPDGIMTIVLPHGVLFRGGEEAVIREKLIEANHIDTIIGLPSGIFFGTGIPTIIIVLKQKRSNSDILIIDASKGFVKDGKNNKLRASDIKRISDTVIQRKSISKFSAVVEKATIRSHGYNLNIPRYVDSSEAAESWDIYASMFGGIPENEIDQLSLYWNTFTDLKTSLFTEPTNENCQLKVEDVHEAINGHTSVKEYVAEFKSEFSDFTEYLKERLLENMLVVTVSKEEEILSQDIFERLADIELIDKYEAYQILDDTWQIIRVDLEMIQTEGFETTCRVDANMVTKKKNGKDVVVQDGWIGRIMPFDLVQSTYLQAELESIKLKEDRLIEIAAELQEILDSLEEDEKESDLINDAQTSFVSTEIAKETKLLKDEVKKNGEFDVNSFEAKILKVSRLLAQEKELKKQVRFEKHELHLKTKETIEALSYEEVLELLELKWITPLVTGISQMPHNLLEKLGNQIQFLQKKYATTYSDVAKEISNAESTLSSLMGQLTGSEADLKGIKELENLLRGEEEND